MSAFSFFTASTEAAAFSNTTSSMPTPRRRANSRARSIDTPTGSPVVASLLARIGLPRLIEARSVPLGAKAVTRAEEGEVVMASVRREGGRRG
ncbi:hypothetical protein D3C87_1400350 [compost metagenome]